MSGTVGLTGTPLVVSVNVDVESLDSERSGTAGLFGRYSYGRYGLREGIWRILEVFRGEGVRATFFIDPQDAGRHPALVETIAGDSHEIAVYGRAMVKVGAPDAAGTERLAAGRKAIEALTGTAPRGWRASNGLLTRATLLDLAAAGYDYDSSAVDDDWPYLMEEGGRSLVELPVAEYLRDATFYAGHHTHERVRKVWREEFDAIHADEGYVHLVLHSRGDVGSGRADRARIVAEFLNRAMRFPGVTSMTCGEAAAACRGAMSPEGFLSEIVAPSAEPQGGGPLPI